MTASQTSLVPTDANAILDLMDVICSVLLSAEEELNALDRAIGDGDHGSNLARASRGLSQLRPELVALPLGEAVTRAGRTVVMSVGGASGPLYGTLLMEMGKALPEQPALSDWAVAFTAGVIGVAKRGRSAEGEKTMLDVLMPAAKALDEKAANARPAEAVKSMVEAAAGGFDASRSLRAKRGRAAYVGERAVGHDDPGARSALLCISTIAKFISEKTG